MTNKEKNKAVAYMRTNKVEVGNQLGDLDKQYQKILTFASSENICIAKSFADYGKDNRSSLHDILAYCRSDGEISMVIATNQTRLSRKLEDFKIWESLFAATGVKLRFVQQPTMVDFDKFLKSFMTSIAKIDAENRRECAKRGFLERSRAGYSIQKPPIGYMRSQTRGVFVKTKNASYLRNSIVKYLDGKLSTDSLQYAVSSLYPANKTLSNSQFKKIVTNPYYVGYVCYNGEKYHGLHEPLLTVAEYKKLIKILG